MENKPRQWKTVHTAPPLEEKFCEGNNCLKKFIAKWPTARRCDQCRKEGRPYKSVEPKQRTIEEVQVGDIMVGEDNKNPAEVVEVLKNIFAYLWNGSVQWITLKRAKELGWKIKQPEPEKETTLDDVQSTLERIEKIEKEKSDILSKLSEITTMYL